jgi:anti-anti-sigma regulatory factor
MTAQVCARDDFGEATMPVQENRVERLSLSLNPILDLRSAGPLKDILQHGLGRGVPLQINASAVTQMSTACAQVLTAFFAEARKDGISLAVTGSSACFDTAFAKLGLAHVLQAVRESMPPQDGFP